LVLVAVAALVYLGARLAFRTPVEVGGPVLTLSPAALPWYALLSVGRMAAAYVLSLVFSLGYGYLAARHRAARTVMMPLLDVLQSVPILSFLPLVLLALTALLPRNVAAELAAIILIFTSQAWNMTFGFYQSMTMVPTELREAAAVFRLGPWARFKTLELPFAAIGLLWNSMMSWSGGWFFLMAAEIFHVGTRDFRLPGLGSYMQQAASQGNLPAVLAGLATLILVIVLLDQFVWRPLTAWTDRFKLEMVEGEEAPTSWVFLALSRSWLVERFGARVWSPLVESIDAFLRRWWKEPVAVESDASEATRVSAGLIVVGAAAVGLIGFGGYRALELLLTLPVAAWGDLARGLAATFLRVAASLGIALLWTVPLGVAIGTNRRLASILQPIVQVVAAIPATALFPLLLLALLQAPGGLNVAAVALMLMGTQWYLLFNVIAGASSIPLDLRYTTDLLRLSRWERWRTLILPALFPFIVTGSITASGGAWNASIVAEHVEFGGRTFQTLGIGSLISQATARGDYTLLLAATLVMVFTVVLVNRLFWQRLYRLAEVRFRMD